VSPTNGEVVHGTSVQVTVAVTGGDVVQTASAYAGTTKGHVHLYLQGQLIYMAYTLTESVPVQPGLTYSMHAEFVGADHIPYTPRDVTPNVFFSVAAS
jgi:hypothetical protein